ncbi:ATP-binding protein [Crenobacter sp. SG2305]|uniref:sensor histidine kinase n=1 Tax=Crenobacter oryzisoli TaxID=3056844 RepID=UPI0025AB3E06|nr:ATP-binding protein [Crenobacter sp. SG2305]MDN0083064.1 ATP-binding protein [Crenobacter sp. SG2305]
MRQVILAVATLGTILLYLLALSTGNTSKLAEYYWWVFGLNALLLTGLVGVIARQLLRLRRRLKQREFGAKLTQKLTVMFALVALMPGVLVFTISAQFLTRSIESWFDVRVESALDRGLDLGRNALHAMLEDVSRKSRVILDDVSDTPDGLLPSRLERLREQLGLSEVSVFSRDGQLIGFAAAQASAVPVPPSREAMRQVTLRRPLETIENEGDRSLVLRVLASYRTLDDQPRILAVRQSAPDRIARDASLIENARSEYRQLLISRDGLKTFYMLTLLLSFLLALTAALAFALFLSERLSAPLSELAAGTRAVAQGDFSKRHPVYRRDELGMLTTLFNRMTQQLEEARHSADENRRQEEAAKLYLESILANLTAGVIAFDASWHLRAANTSAAHILGIDFSELVAEPFTAWATLKPAMSPLIDIVREKAASAKKGQWQQQFDYVTPKESLILLARGTPLPERSGSGYVVVFDDITELLRAQRDAAWGEVAKRLAHEIRNPLTPIQLAAERLAMKLSDKLAGPDADMLRRSTDTIVKQVGALKGMVDAFRDYARAPRTQLSPLDVNGVIREVLTLYEANPALRVDLVAGPLRIMGDAALLRQVLHNLLQNAQDAVLDVDIPMIHISSRLVGHEAQLCVEDSGSGFSPDILPRAFEPYVTNKPKGTGLGLAVVKKIIEEHHGAITLSNAEPHGARILITLPLLEA